MPRLTAPEDRAVLGLRRSERTCNQPREAIRQKAPRGSIWMDRIAEAASQMFTR